MMMIFSLDLLLKVHKELQDTIAQLEAIKHEIRTISFMNPGPLTTRLVDNINNIPAAGAGIRLNKILTTLLSGYSSLSF